MSRTGLPDPVELLRLRPRENYLDAALPSRRDEQISQYLAGLVSESRIAKAAGLITPEPATVLLPYAQRVASLAVRQRAPELLRAGLRAVALAAALDGDFRDQITVLALLWNSAELLGLDASAEFASTADRAGRFGDRLRQFAGREPGLRSLEEMGYAAVGEGADFHYECRWPRPSRTTPA